MLTVVFAISTGICAAGWYFNRLAAKGFARFIVKNGYTLPTPEELRVCIREAATKHSSK